MDSSYSSHSSMSNLPRRNLNSVVERKYAILPKIQDFKAVNKTDNKISKGSYLTNFYHYSFKDLGQKDNNVYMYSIFTNPPIPADNRFMLGLINKQILKKLNRKLDIITSRGNTIWAKRQSYKQVIMIDLTKSCARLIEKFPNEFAFFKYQVMIEPVKIFRLADIIKDDDVTIKPLLVQMINSQIKENLQSKGFFELGKGRYYHQKYDEIASEVMKEFCLNVMKGYKFSFKYLETKKQYLQLDSCSRVLPMQSFYDVFMSASGSFSQKVDQFRGQTVLARYGKYKTYVIQEIVQNLTTESKFSMLREGKQIQISYSQYYLQAYNLKIKIKNQPLVKVIAKVQKKIAKTQKVTKNTQAIFLIPQFIYLTALSESQRNDHVMMKQLSDVTRLTPMKRYQLNEQLKNALKDSNIKINQSVKMQGYKLTPPIIELHGGKQIKVQQGSFEFKESIKEPHEFKNGQWAYVYSSATSQPRANQYLALLQYSSLTFNIKFSEPEYIHIDYNKKSKDMPYYMFWAQNVMRSIQNYEEKTKKKISIIVVALEKKEHTFYNALKRIFTIKLRCLSQFFKVETLEHKGKAASAAGKIGLQICAKIGKKLWTVKKMHPYWQGKNVAAASISYSKGLRNNFTLGIVGTINKYKCITKYYQHFIINMYRLMFRNQDHIQFCLRSLYGLSLLSLRVQRNWFLLEVSLSKQSMEIFSWKQKSLPFIGSNMSESFMAFLHLLYGFTLNQYFSY